MSFLPGLFPGAAAAAAAPPIELTYIGTTESSTDTTSYTFTNSAIGAADATRYVVVVASAGQTANNFGSIPSITIGGSAATPHAGAAAPAGVTKNHTSVAIAGRAVASGTTATIVVSFSSAQLGCAVSVYRIVNAVSNTPFDTASNIAAATSVSTTIDIPLGGCLIVGGACKTVQAQTTTGATEDIDNANDQNQHVAAHVDAPMSAQTGRTIGISSASSSNRAVVGASWV